MDINTYHGNGYIISVDSVIATNFEYMSEYEEETEDDVFITFRGYGNSKEEAELNLKNKVEWYRDYRYVFTGNNPHSLDFRDFRIQ